ncbi:MAG: hypothetical protein DMD67_09585 [Gemmatimonadetes bacterium]|nr:MAG: hypothetical protein DMD67_09585 [Gemmatimonadota bacterium]
MCGTRSRLPRRNTRWAGRSPRPRSVPRSGSCSITDVGPNDFLVWDDCFSFPELLVRVTRAHAVTVSYTDLKGKQRTMEAEGPMAELLQHEIDHLDGILALDRPSGVDPFAFRVEWEKLHPPEERYGPPKPREV